MNLKTIQETRFALMKKETTARKIVEDYLDKISKQNEDINAFITVMEEEALKKADAIDAKISEGKNIGPLVGVVYAAKDNLSTKDVLTSCASKSLSNYFPSYNATVVERMNQAGAICIGKTNLDEFAMGATTETSYYGPTRNPLDLSRVPGGSSGGSAAAVAAKMCAVSLGSDTGGSIRQPAAYCGIYGMKPTYGAVSRNGLIAFASSLDQIGPLADNVDDLATVLNVITGHDIKDATSINIEHPDYLAKINMGVVGKRFGIPKEYMSDVVDADVRNKIKEAAAILVKLGAVVEEVSLPTLSYSIPTYYLIATAEASSNLARFDGVRYGVRKEEKDVISMFKATRGDGFGTEVKRRIMLGTYALSAGYYDAYYLKALKVRRLLQESFSTLFESYDMLLAPSSIQVAPHLGENLDAIHVYQQDICTCPVNLAGLPALSLPFGEKNGMPIGLQIIGPPWGEERLLQTAKALANAEEGGAKDEV